MKETKEEQDEIWEEFYQEARDCVDIWVDIGLYKDSFFTLKDDYIILRKPKEEIKQ